MTYSYTGGVSLFNGAVLRSQWLSHSSTTDDSVIILSGNEMRPILPNCATNQTTYSYAGGSGLLIGAALDASVSLQLVHNMLLSLS